MPKKIKLGSLTINNFKIIDDVPKKPLGFRSLIEIKIITEHDVEPSSLKKLKNFMDAPIIVYENSGKRSEKKIFDVRYKINSKNKFTLKIDAEGGLPIKRFLIGDNVVPGISQTIENNCKCDEFDFLEIKMITDN